MIVLAFEDVIWKSCFYNLTALLGTSWAIQIIILEIHFICVRDYGDKYNACLSYKSNLACDKENDCIFFSKKLHTYLWNDIKINNTLCKNNISQKGNLSIEEISRIIF